METRPTGEGGWPEFRLVTLPVGGGVDGRADSNSDTIQVPASLLGYSYVAVEQPEIVESSGKGRLLRFGTSGLSEMICMDLDGGMILQLDSSATSARAVNSSLAKFNETTKAIIERFPFYGEEAEMDQFEAVSIELADIIRRIDPSVLTVDSFWDTFINDVAIGDYATEEFVEDL